MNSIRARPTEVLFLCSKIIFLRRKESEGMKKMTNNVIDTYNVVTGSIVAVLSYVLGEHWFLFIAYLGLNMADQFTGWLGAKMEGKVSSRIGWMGSWLYWLRPRCL